MKLNDEAGYMDPGPLAHYELALATHGRPIHPGRSRTFGEASANQASEYDKALQEVHPRSPHSRSLFMALQRNLWVEGPPLPTRLVALSQERLSVAHKTGAPANMDLERVVVDINI